MYRKLLHVDTNGCYYFNRIERATVEIDHASSQGYECVGVCVHGLRSYGFRHKQEFTIKNNDN